MTTEVDEMIAVEETAGTATSGTHAVIVKKSVKQTILATVSAKVAETVMEEIANDVVTETAAGIAESATTLGTVIMKTAMTEARKTRAIERDVTEMPTETQVVTEMLDVTEILDVIATMAVTGILGATETVMTETIGTTVVHGLTAIGAGTTMTKTRTMTSGTASAETGTRTVRGATLTMRTGRMRAGTEGMRAAARMQTTSSQTTAARPNKAETAVVALPVVGTSSTSTQHQHHQSSQTQHRAVVKLGGPLLVLHQHQHPRQPLLPGTCWTWTHAVSTQHQCKPPRPPIQQRLQT